MKTPWIVGTSSTGGTGALTVTAITGRPTFSNAYGSSGSVPVVYDAQEWTDSSRSTVKQKEAGVGDYNLATGVLTRTRVEETWDGTNYKYGANASALNFGSTSANILITCSPDHLSFLDNFPIAKQQDGYLGGLYLANTEQDSTAGNSSGNAIFFPVRISGRLALITSVELDLTLAAATSTVSALFFGLYKQSTSDGGGATTVGGLYADFGNGSSISTLAATGVKTGTLSTPVPNLGGVYWGCLLMTYNQPADTPKVRSYYAVDQIGASNGGGFHIETWTFQSGLSALPSTPSVAGSQPEAPTPLLVFA